MPLGEHGNRGAPIRESVKVSYTDIARRSRSGHRQNETDQIRTETSFLNRQVREIFGFRGQEITFRVLPRLPGKTRRQLGFRPHSNRRFQVGWRAALGVLQNRIRSNPVELYFAVLPM